MVSPLPFRKETHWRESAVGHSLLASSCERVLPTLPASYPKTQCLTERDLRKQSERIAIL